MKYYNQNNYPNTPYPSSANKTATVKSGGCGVCCGSNILSFYGYNYPPDKLAPIYIDKGARVSGGTDMTKAAKIICELGNLSYTTTNDENVLITHIKAGGIAIANVDGDIGAKGIFSNEGHYINIIGYDGKPPKPFIVFDVGYYSGKFNSSYRKGHVSVFTDEFGNTCQYTTQEALDIDTKNRTPNYYLFSKKEETKVANKYSYDDVVDKMIIDGVTTTANMAYWEGVLAGKEPVSPEFLRTILGRYQNKVRGA